jgi:hypothetical protein
MGVHGSCGSPLQGGRTPELHRRLIILARVFVCDRSLPLMVDQDNNAAMTPRERSSQLGQVQELLTSSLLKGRGTPGNTGRKMWSHSTTARLRGFSIAISTTDRRTKGSAALAIRPNTLTARRHRTVRRDLAPGSAPIRSDGVW